MVELKPCPFCGGEAELTSTNDNKRRPFVRCRYGCYETLKCPLTYLVSWEYHTDEEAIWLTRVISDYAALVDADGYCSYGERKEAQE